MKNARDVDIMMNNYVNFANTRLCMNIRICMYMFLYTDIVHDSDDELSASSFSMTRGAFERSIKS